MVVNAVMTKETLSSFLGMFSRWCAPLLFEIWYIYPGLWWKLIARWLYCTPPPHLAGCDVAVNVIHWPNIPEALNYPLKKHRRDASEYVFTDHFSSMFNTRRKHVKCCICKKKLFHENRLEAHYQQYHPILMNEGLSTDRILPPAGWDRPEPSWFDFSRCTWMAINELVN